MNHFTISVKFSLNEQVIFCLFNYSIHHKLYQHIGNQSFHRADSGLCAGPGSLPLEKGEEFSLNHLFHQLHQDLQVSTEPAGPEVTSHRETHSKQSGLTSPRKAGKAEGVQNALSLVPDGLISSLSSTNVVKYV